MKKYKIHKLNKRALSPIFATLILAAIVITFGSVAYYYANNVTTNATNDYVASVESSQQSISERVGFQDAVFIQDDISSSPTLTVYIINCGRAHNLQVNAVILDEYDIHTNDLISTTPYNILPNTQTSAPPSTFIKINDGGEVKSLNVGDEGFFTINLAPGTSLSPGHYNIQLITQRGSSFDYAP